MKITFTKMHAIGNDYVYVDCTTTDQLPKSVACAFARFASQRHVGIGSDGVIVLRPSRDADLYMDMYNADGSQGKMCGNGIRCVAKYAYERKVCKKDCLDIETLSGVKRVWLNITDNCVGDIRVDMGLPQFAPSKIPVKWSKSNMLRAPISIEGQLFNVTAVSMGNPHAVVFTKDIDTLDLGRVGPLFEHHQLFPEGVNTEFTEIIDRHTLNVRVWERGSGETMACGTGACAVLAAAVKNDLSDREATVHLKGGNLQIAWPQDDASIQMTGPATFVFDGTIDFDKKEQP